MKDTFDSLLATEFVPVGEVKAKLSEKIRQVTQGKRIAITSNGRPQALLLSYRDYLELLQTLRVGPSFLASPVIDLETWKQGANDRKKIRRSMARHFNPDRLSRKGQKNYKRESVGAFKKKS